MISYDYNASSLLTAMILNWSDKTNIFISTRPISLWKKYCKKDKTVIF